MTWVDRLQDVTGWRGERWRCDWQAAEAELGVALPSDYKELCERFGPGYFSDYIRVFMDRGDEGIVSWWRSTLQLFRGDPPDIYAPHRLYGLSGQDGLLWWSSSEWGVYFWLADSRVDPDKWPVLARTELGPAGEWHRFDISVSEFIFKAITDAEFKPFSVAGGIAPQFYRFDPEEDYEEE